MIEFDRVEKRYGDSLVVDDLSFKVERGEFICLVGSSGCGKTTTLKMVNRLIEPTGGRILINGSDAGAMDKVRLRREIGYVIQQIGLFPHFTVADNVAAVLRLKGWDRARIAARVDELLRMVSMEPATFRDRRPHQLSGGQQQRVGVLRALAAEPEIILMDEPFGALDPITRDVLQRELKRLQDRLHKTILFVTHDMDEALLLADRIALMRDGRLVQLGTPQELVRHPADPFVEAFLGAERILQHPEWLTVGRLMEPPAAQIPAQESVAEARQRLANGAVALVVAEGQLLGYVDGPLLGGAAGEARVRDIARPLTFMPPETPLLEGLQQMLTEQGTVFAVGEPGSLPRGILRAKRLAALLGTALAKSGALR